MIAGGDQILGLVWERILVTNTPARDAWHGVKDNLGKEDQPVLESIKGLEG